MFDKIVNSTINETIVVELFISFLESIEFA